MDIFRSKAGTKLLIICNGKLHGHTTLLVWTE